VEQEYGEPSSATSLAARTVLPGEPFQGPAVPAVPGPRNVPAEQEMSAPPQWNFAPEAQGEFTSPPPPRSFDPSTYDPTYGAVADPHHAPAAAFTPTYATADSLTAPEQLQSLHEFGALPVTQGYAPPAPAAPAYPAPVGYDFGAPPAYPAPAAPAYPSPAGDLPAYPAAASWPAQQQPAFPQQPVAAFAPQQAQLAPPMPPVEAPPTGEDAEGGHRKSGRRPNTALLALAAVVVLGGGGYFGYTQLSKSDSTDTSSSTPVTSVAPKTPTASTPATTAPVVTPTTSAAFSYPSRIAGYPLRAGANAAALQRQITTFSKGAYPTYMGTPAIASYGTSASASIVAITFHPTAGKLPAGFATMLAGVHKPAAGNTVGTFSSVPAGAAGGAMTCGSQTGASPITYCVWQGKSATGMVYMPGLTDVPINQAVTRELRAYAEH
jgi:hypothetical protein